jgi:hypothetical protein
VFRVKILKPEDTHLFTPSLHILGFSRSIQQGWSCSRSRQLLHRKDAEGFPASFLSSVPKATGRKKSQDETGSR